MPQGLRPVTDADNMQIRGFPQYVQRWMSLYRKACARNARLGYRHTLRDCESIHEPAQWIINRCRSTPPTTMWTASASAPEGSSVSRPRERACWTVRGSSPGKGCQEILQRTDWTAFRMSLKHW